VTIVNATEHALSVKMSSSHEDDVFENDTVSELTADYFFAWHLEDTIELFYDIKDACHYHPQVFEFLSSVRFVDFVMNHIFHRMPVKLHPSKQRDLALFEEHFDSFLPFLFEKVSLFLNTINNKHGCVSPLNYTDFIHFCANNSHLK
jgi:hypothetical protein